MTRGHLLSFGLVWRNEKWREIQASISLFKFLIMEVSLSLNGWSILVFFFIFLMVFCVIVYLCWGGRNDLIKKKIKVWFWSYQCSLLSFGQIRWKSNGYYADLRGRANGGGGLSKSSASVLARARKQGRFLIMIWSFSWQRWSRLQPMPPLPLATSLKLVHSFFYHSSFVLLKEAPQGFCSMLARAPA